MDGNNQMDNNQTYINNENNLLVFMTKLGDRSEKKKDHSFAGLQRLCSRFYVNFI